LHYSHQIKLFDQIYGLQFVFTQIYLFYLIQGYIYIEAKVIKIKKSLNSVVKIKL
jgi:hypothetical protein